MAEPRTRPFRVIEGDFVPAEQDEQLDQHVGAFLREARENTGKSLADVAISLHIRSKFLKSIEDGRQEDMPGPTYAVGFFRSYADYLGLDTEALVTQFKTEMSGVESRPGLEFPVPSTDGWFPTGKVVAICALLSAVVFAGWFYLQNEHSVDVAAVPAPPGYTSTIAVEADPQIPVAAAPVDGETTDDTKVAAVLLAAPEADTSPATTEATTTDEVEEPYQLPVPISALIVTDPAATEEDLKRPAPVEAVVETPSPATITEAPKPTEPSPLDVNELTPSSAVIAEPSPPVAEPRAVVEAPPAPRAVPAAPEPATQVAALPSIPTNSQETAASDEGRTYGVINQEARVVIGARADSWVQVLDNDQNVLLTRMLRAGDRYLVPNRQDLVMLTGNAGGLIISVDGAPVPKIGSDGAILHNVRLDVDLLKAGRAVIE